MRFGGGENEHDVRGRLFERFQKRVERAVRKHMHFVDDINFIFSHRGGILHFFPQIAHFRHAVVGCGVDLHDIEAVLQRAAGFAYAAGRSVYGAFAVDGARKNTGDARFSRSARSAKQIRMSRGTGFDLVAEYAHDALLPDDFIERIGTEFSIE